MRARIVLASVAVCATLVAAGCGGGTTEVAEPVVVEPPLEAARETTGSPLEYREYVLPAGGKVTGYGDGLACLLEPEPDGEAYTAIRVLDLKTGEHERVVDSAIGREDGFDVLSARCSDEWLVWEEMLGDCFESPLDVRWALYALNLDGCMRVGEPILVAKAVTSEQSRPLFSVMGDTVYWMTNSVENARQEGVIDQARIWSRRLPDGEQKLVYRTDAGVFTFSAQPDGLLVTETVDRNKEPMRLVVLDAASGAVIDTVDLENDTWLSHYAAYRNGQCAWAIGDDETGTAGELLMRFPDGRRVSVARNANDAVFVGDLLFFEHKPSVAKGTASRVDHWRVCALDPKTLEYTVVFDEEARVFGWVAPIGVAPQAEKYVMYRSVPPWITEEPPGTWVRVYSVD